MERPLEDATTANLWKTLFALIVELSLRSGLVTQEELVPALATTLTNVGMRPGTASQEEGSQEGHVRWKNSGQKLSVGMIKIPIKLSLSFQTKRVQSEGWV